MRDVSRAAHARAAYLRAEGSLEFAYQDETLLLDLLTLLVLVRGPECTEADIRDAWLVNAARRPQSPVSFDLVDSDPGFVDFLHRKDRDAVRAAAAACRDLGGVV